MVVFKNCIPVKWLDDCAHQLRAWRGRTLIHPTIDEGNQRLWCLSWELMLHAVVTGLTENLRTTELHQLRFRIYKYLTLGWVARKTDSYFILLPGGEKNVFSLQNGTWTVHCSQTPSADMRRWVSTKKKGSWKYKESQQCVSAKCLLSPSSSQQLSLDVECRWSGAVDWSCPFMFPPLRDRCYLKQKTWYEELEICVCGNTAHFLLEMSGLKLHCGLKYNHNCSQWLWWSRQT